MAPAKIAQAKIDTPREFFTDPQDVINDPGLSKHQKREVLDGLEQDAIQLADAATEGMTGGPANQLHDILDAKDALAASPGQAIDGVLRAGSAAEATLERAMERLDP